MSNNNNAPLEPEIVEPEDVGGTDELNEFDRVPSNILVLTASVKKAIVQPYGCDNCGHAFEMVSEPDYCPECGVRFLQTFDQTRDETIAAPGE
jgi:predicted Zn-ribbon and HTH transcriptional regulator